MRIKEYSYKYVHLMFCIDSKFFAPLVNMINDPNNGFDATEHLFVVKTKNLYQEFKHYNNVVLDETSPNFYTKYAKLGKWLISHSAESKINMIKTSRKIMQRVIFRYWGGSRTTGLQLCKGRHFHNIKVIASQIAFKYIFSSFAAIGIGGPVDIADLSRLLKGVRYYRLPYADREQCSSTRTAIDKALSLESSCKEVNVLLGHRGKPEGNHIEILKILQKYDQSKLNIYVPLSYGDEKYISYVKNHIECKNYKNVHVIDNFMPFDKYCQMLGNMDIGIFDGTTSYALGNIGLMLAMKKTIFLRNGGILQKTFYTEGVPYKPIDEIPNMTLNTFIQSLEYNVDKCALAAHGRFELVIDNWKKLFSDFN